MKLNKKLSLAVIALGMASAIPASAVTVASGDLILGFRSTNTSLQGNGVSYVVNLGQSSQYGTTIAAPITVGGSSTTGADLAAIYGGEWMSRTDIQWGVIGGTSGNNLFASKAQSNSVTIPTAWQISTQSGRNLAYSDVTNVIGIGINGGLDDSAATSNTSFAAQQLSSYTNNWRGYLAPGGTAGQAGSTGNVDFYSFASPGIEGTPGQTLALFNVTGSTASNYVGSFSLASNGAITFVPEPSSALLLCGSLIPLFSRRRKNA